MTNPMADRMLPAATMRNSVTDQPPGCRSAQREYAEKVPTFPPHAILAGMAKRLEHRAEFADFRTESLLELREEYRAGRVKLVEREPDAEVRAR